MKKTQILVVEDEGIVSEDIRKSLQNLGYTVSAVASSGEEALKETEENLPDLVLMDIVLKGKLDGIETAAQIRSRYNIPVIYLTAYTDVKTLERAKMTEPLGYIVKPFDDRELRTAVEMALYKSKMENRLREREEWLSTILKSIGDAVIVTDEQGRVKFMNSVAESLTGWEETEASGEPLGRIFNIINEKTRQKVEDPVSKVLKKGGIVGLANHTVLISRDGVEIPIDDSGAPVKDDNGKIIGVVLVFHDIIQRRKAEEALRESEEKYRTITHSAQDAIIMLDDQGDISYWNPAAEKIFGYTKEEALGKETHTLLGPEKYHKAYKKGFEKFQKTGQGRVLGKTIELTALKKDGTEFPVELSVASIHSQGKWLATGILRDITDRKQAEQEKDKLQKQFLQAQKMESIGTLAGGIAHDFNNLLMGIQGHISLMMNDVEQTHPFYARLQNIQEQVESGSNLTVQLLGFARRGKYDAKPTDMNDLIKKSVRMFGRTKKEITVREKYAPDLWMVNVDPGQIEQVLLNLYVNAWQAMRDKGDLYIDTSNIVLEDERLIETYNVRPGKYIKISVTDTGVGMDAATQRQIFDPFFTTKEMGRGTGLGLASSYGIIKNHGGVINVYSEKDIGTTFNIYLPAVEETGVVQEASPVSQEMERGKETILLVDDEQIILDVGKEMMEALGYEVLLATAGEEAIQCYKDHKENIDLVILDMILPGMSGKEIYTILKGINENIKVLVSSGYNMDGEAAEVLRQGASNFIQKPFTMKDLSHKIREVLDT